MQWNHLPVAGGLYDQDPVMLERFLYIFEQIAQKEREERDKEEKKARRKSGPRPRVRNH